MRRRRIRTEKRTQRKLADSLREHSNESLEYRALSIRADSANTDERSVEITVATESPVAMYDWDRGEAIPEILLMSGVQLPPNNQVVMLDSHSRYDTSDVVGSVRNLRIDGNTLSGTARFSSLAEDAWTKVREGHIKDVSAGYRVLAKSFVPAGTKQKINGRDYEGPVNVVTSWKIREVSVVPIGADELAKIRKERSHMDPELRALLIAQGMPESHTDDEARAWLANHFKATPTANPTPTPAPTPTPSPAPAVSPPVTTGGDNSRLEALEVELRQMREANAARDLQDRARANIRAAGLDAEQERTLMEQVQTGSIRTLDGVRDRIFDILSQNSPQVNTITAGRQQREKVEQAVDSMLQVRYLRPLYRSQERFDAAFPAARRVSAPEWETFQYYSLVDLARACLEAEGVNTRGIPIPVLSASALGFGSQFFSEYPQLRRAYETRAADPGYHTTGMFNFITGNLINRSLQAGYTEVNTTWQNIVIPGPDRPDFRAYNMISLSETPYLEEWSDNDVPNQVSITDIKEDNAVRARAVGISFSWQTLINDDLGAFSRTNAELGASAARTLNNHVWSTLTDTNLLLQDGIALFSDATGNRKKDNLIGSGSGAPTQARLAAMRELMRLQVGLNDRDGNASLMKLNLEPSILAVPVALEEEALTVTGSAYDISQTNSISMNTARRYRVVVEPLLDDNSATAYYLFAEPSERAWADLRFLSGYREPRLRSVEDPHTLSVKTYITHVYQCKPIDFRPVVKNVGTA